MAKIIGRGAEAIISLKGTDVVKERIKKSYRHPAIDKKLRQFRTRREAKILERLALIEFPAPKLIEVDDKAMTVSMDHISGQKIRDILEKSDYKKLSSEIGSLIAELHNNDIIHSDLTTSNMILTDKGIFFIDFGLGFFSEKVEDKAVDLHLLKQALESKHHRICEQCFDHVLKSYKKRCKSPDEILNRLDQVEARGRYKGKW